MLRQEFSSVKPGYHLNKMHWNTVIADHSIPTEQILWMIDHSYDLAATSLPKLKRQNDELNGKIIDNLPQVSKKLAFIKQLSIEDKDYYLVLDYVDWFSGDEAVKCG